MGNKNFSTGERHYEDGNYKLALENFLKAKEQGIGTAELFNYIGRCLSYLNRYDEAVEYFDKAILVESTWIRPYFNKGHAYMKMGLFGKAYEFMTKATSMDPNEPDGYYYLGVLHEKQKDFDKAREFYEKALELDPEISEAHNNLGLLLFDIGDYNKALEHFELAIKFDPTDGNGYLNKGILLKTMGLMEQAKRTLLSGLKVVPRDIDILFCLGNLYLDKKNFKRAIDYYNEVLNIEPTDVRSIRNKKIAEAKIESSDRRHIT